MIETRGSADPLKQHQISRSFMKCLITKDDLALYKTVVIDTAGRALDFLTTDILKENYKLNMFLAELIFNIKEKLNQMSETQKIRQEKIVIQGVGIQGERIMPEIIKGSADPLKQHQISRSFFKCLTDDEFLIDRIKMEIAIDALIKRLAQEIPLVEIKELLEKVLYE